MRIGFDQYTELMLQLNPLTLRDEIFFLLPNNFRHRCLLLLFPAFNNSQTLL